jgi:hypothetical protein
LSAVLEPPPVTATLDRRRLLAVAGSLVGLPAVAGCAGDRGDGTTAGPTGTATASPTSTATDTPEETAAGAGETAETTAAGEEGSPTPAGDLDLREANVTAVAVESADGGYRLDVTLYHDDDGESGYANWWQVESYAGDRLGRRDLLHAHGTREFTRSATVTVPDGTRCVVVRGHDQTHGYGGQAMLVDLQSGATRAVRQGPEPRSFADAACPIDG